jgi:hypothetical protein
MTEDEVGTGYCALMEELKARVDTVVEFVHNVSEHQSVSQLRHNTFVFEGLYLQLRKICELISLGVLLVHHVQRESWSKKIMKEWHPDVLLSEVTKLNPEAFPKPIVPTEWTPSSAKQVAALQPVFTGEELSQLYWQCGDRMHVGSLKSILAGKTRKLDQAFVKEWAAKFRSGLGNHMIVMPDKGRGLLVRMAAPDTNHVQCTFATIV